MAIQAEMLDTRRATERRNSARTARAPQRPSPGVALHPALIAAELAAGGGQPFTLQVSGSSMRDALLNPGDTVMLQRCHDLQDGELVALRVLGDEALRLRRVFAEGGDWLRLVPEDPAAGSTRLLSNQIQIVGRVLAVMRQPR